MLSVAFSLAIVSAPVALHLQELRGVSAEDEAALLAAIGTAIETRTAQPTARDRGPCPKAGKCLAEIAQRTSAGHVVLLRILGVPTRIRILAERSPGDISAEIDVPRSRDGWPPALATLAEKLFPTMPPPPELAAEPHLPPAPEPWPRYPTPVPDEVDETVWVPWLAVGAGGLALAIGSGFGLSSRSARDEARERPHSMRENEELEDRAIGHGLAANVMFGLAVVGIGAGVALFVMQ